jgi:hypothetical protein
MKTFLKPALAATAAFSFAATLAASTAAEAKQMCGWYAIAYCSTSQPAVAAFANNGWGAVINTSNFRGFAPGKFCAVSGPQSKDSAARDMGYAIANGVTKSIYMKRACADEKYIGD